MGHRERLLQLAADLGAEREALERIIGEADRCLEDLRTRPPSSLEVRGAGAIVHDFYNAVERFLERVAVDINGALPGGPDSHRRLLASMSRDLPEVRPAVFDAATRERLEEYLRFRHLFRHGYGFALEWAKIQPLLKGILALAGGLREDLDRFVSVVNDLAARTTG